MGIAGFFLWLKQHYAQCIENIPQPVVDAALKHQASPDSVGGRYRYDNLYIDMNGLLHPCCHDTAPLPEPTCEEEMFQRLFDQLDLLVKVVRPRKCLVLCVDGVAPRSKMNQQRSRRFRSVDERLEVDGVVRECADIVERDWHLPRPESRVKWDHNVITPATEFMDRMGLAVEWFLMKKLNEDPVWRQLAVVYSDAHVPGEGEHKIMQYIRGLRAQPGYHPSTTHVIHGMDADLICLGLSLHEEHVSILRNQLTETFQPDSTRFCYFNLHTYRAALKEDFANITDMDFECVLDDFVYLCFFVGNDFLPHIPLVSIKTQGIELLLDHYVRSFDAHGYLTSGGEVDFTRLATFLRQFVDKCMPKLRQAYHGVERARRRAVVNVDQRVKALQRTLAQLRRIARVKVGRGQEASDGGDVTDEEGDGESSAAEDAAMVKAMEEAAKMDPAALAGKVLAVMVDLRKEQMRFVGGQQTLGFSYLGDDYRDAYYTQKFGWRVGDDRGAFEQQVRACCAEYLRGTQWVMRYYTRGCASWGWFYPYHYAPLLQDLAAFDGAVNVSMKMGAPLHPIEQLLAVLPRQSVHALPQPLHAAILDPASPLGPFYPHGVDVDFSEANFSYQGVLRLPFIDCKALRRATRSIAELEPDTPMTLVFCHERSALARRAVPVLSAQIPAARQRSKKRSRSGETADEGEKSHTGEDPRSAAPSLVGLVPITAEIAGDVPIAGSIGPYPAEWPLHARIDCLDAGLAARTSFGAPITNNAVRCLRYEMSHGVGYRAELLAAGGEARVRSSASSGDDREDAAAPRRKKARADSSPTAAAPAKASASPVKVSGEGKPTKPTAAKAKKVAAAAKAKSDHTAATTTTTTAAAAHRKAAAKKGRAAGGSSAVSDTRGRVGSSKSKRRSDTVVCAAPPPARPDGNGAASAAARKTAAHRALQSHVTSRVKKGAVGAAAVRRARPSPSPKSAGSGSGGATRRKAKG